MKLIHPASGRTTETDESRASRYLDQGWRLAPASTPESDPEASSTAPTKKAARRRTNTQKGQS